METAANHPQSLHYLLPLCWVTPRGLDEGPTDLIDEPLRRLRRIFSSAAFGAENALRWVTARP